MWNSSFKKDISNLSTRYQTVKQSNTAGKQFQKNPQKPANQHYSNSNRNLNDRSKQQLKCSDSYYVDSKASNELQKQLRRSGLFQQNISEHFQDFVVGRQSPKVAANPESIKLSGKKSHQRNSQQNWSPAYNIHQANHGYNNTQESPNFNSPNANQFSNHSNRSNPILDFLNIEHSSHKNMSSPYNNYDNPETELFEAALANNLALSFNQRNNTRLPPQPIRSEEIENYFEEVACKRSQRNHNSSFHQNKSNNSQKISLKGSRCSSKHNMHQQQFTKKVASEALMVNQDNQPFKYTDSRIHMNIKEEDLYDSQNPNDQTFCFCDYFAGLFKKKNR